MLRWPTSLVGAADDFIKLTGQKFGRWTVIERAGCQQYANRTEPLWLCVCECGTEALVRGANLRNGKSRSCGCLRNERVAAAARKRGKKA